MQEVINFLMWPETLHSAMRGTTSLAGFCFAMATVPQYLDPMMVFWAGVVAAGIVASGMSRLRSRQDPSPRSIPIC